jgi:hypothetical protein
MKGDTPVNDTNDLTPDSEYPGLPVGAFHITSLPPQAITSKGSTDPGVWSASVTMILSAVDPKTGQPHHGGDLRTVSAGAVSLAAATSHSLASTYTKDSEDRIEQLEAAAKADLVDAVDIIEHSTKLLDEPVTGPDGETTTARGIQATQAVDEAIARERSKEGDSRHTQREWAEGWRLVVATLLGLLDVLLLWKPVLNLPFEHLDSGGVFRWSVGLGLAALQVFAIDWAVRHYVESERSSVDRRGGLGDYNRSLRSGVVSLDRAEPDVDELVEADSRMSQMYSYLIAVATGIALIGGARVAFLSRRAGVEIYEAALFGVIIGLLLGGVVVQMARLSCRGNLLGDRLRAASDTLSDVDAKIQFARGEVAGKRQNALAALAAAEVSDGRITQIWRQTVADYWLAVVLAWTWFGLPQEDIDRDAFMLAAEPRRTGTDTDRENMRTMLDKVNVWLANRPTLFTEGVTLLPVAATPSNTGVLVPLEPPSNGKVTIVGPRLVEVPPRPKAPHRLMLVGAVVTVAATLAAAVLAPTGTGDVESARQHGHSVAATTVR